MLGSDDGFYDSGQVVDIGEGLHAEEDVVESALLAACSVFWCADNCSTEQCQPRSCPHLGARESLPLRGLKRSFPKVADLQEKSIACPRTTGNGEGAFVDVLEGDAVLMDSIEARLPYQGHVAGVRRLEPPREEGRDSISTDYTHLHQRAVIQRHGQQQQEEEAQESVSDRSGGCTPPLSQPSVSSRLRGGGREGGGLKGMV